MGKIIAFLKENMNWIFDGIGVAVFTFLAGFFIKDKIEKIIKNKGKNNIQKNIEGDNKGNQEIVNSPNSQPILVQGDYINGITEKQVKEVALEVFKANFAELSVASNNIALQRAEELTNEFLDMVFQKNSKLIEKFTEPGFQYSFINAQIQYAKTGEKITKEILIEALNKRIETPEQTLKQKIYDETIVNISKITPEQMNFLALWYVVLCKKEAVGNKEALKTFIDNKILKFYSNDYNNSQFFQYLYYTGCAKVLSEGGTFKPIEELFKNHYSGIFSKGFTEDEFKSKVDTDIEKYNKVLINCLNDSTKLQFDALNENDLRGRIKEFNITENVDKIIRLEQEKQMDVSEVRKELIKICPEIESLLTLWKDSREVKSLELTPIGMTIAILNYNRATGEDIDIDKIV